MNSRRSATMILLLALAATASSCATLNPTNFVAKLAGTKLGAALADQLPVQTATAVTEKGGNFCDTARALRAPVPVAGLPRNQATQFALAVDEFGSEHGCW